MVLCNKLFINSSKTKLIIYSKKNTDQINLILHGKLIDKVSQYQYLGILLDEKLTFIPYLKNLRFRLSKLVGITYYIGKLLDIKTSKTFYHSVVKSIIQYNIPFWGSSFVSYTALIQICQNKIIRNLFRNKLPELSTSQLFSECNIFKIIDLYKLEKSYLNL